MTCRLLREACLVNDCLSFRRLHSLLHTLPLPASIVFPSHPSSSAHFPLPTCAAVSTPQHHRHLHIASHCHGRYISATDSLSEVADYDDRYTPEDDEGEGTDRNAAVDLHSSIKVAELVDTGEADKCRDEGFLVVNFYALVSIQDPQDEVVRHTSFMKDKNINGRIYISSQGINAQYSGPQEEALAYAEWVKEDPRFADLYVQVSPSFCGHAFPRLRLRYKPSLIQVEGGTSFLPLTDPSSRAIPLTPKQWREKLCSVEIDPVSSSDSSNADSTSSQRKNILLLDVRNGYEWDVGHFKGARRPEVDCFKSTRFGLHSIESKENDPLGNVDKERTDVLMYCTGGIRCDVYSTILRQQGFKNLYTLKGGVARYLIEEGDKNWLGNLFVFDSRLSVPPSAYKLGAHHFAKEIEDFESPGLQADRWDFGRCSLCDTPLSTICHRNCANLDCNRLHLSCESCSSQMKGCCSQECTSASRLRPYLKSFRQYNRWHNYRAPNQLALRPSECANGNTSTLRRSHRCKKQAEYVADDTPSVSLKEPVGNGCRYSIVYSK